MSLAIIITGSILGYLAIGAVMAYLAGLFDQADTSTLFWITWAWPAFVFVAAVYVVCIPAMLAMSLGQEMRRRNEDKPIQPFPPRPIEPPDLSSE